MDPLDLVKPADFYVDGWENLDWLQELLEEKCAPHKITNLTARPRRPGELWLLCCGIKGRKGFTRKLGDQQKEGVKPKEGFMAAIRRIFIRWKDDPEGLPESVVVKIPSPKTASEAWEKSQAVKSDDLDDFGSKVITFLHYTESDAYSRLEGSGLQIPRVFMNRNVGSNNPKEFPVLVMEDLSKYEIMDVLDGMNEAKLFSVVDFLVDLHFFSFHRDDLQSFGLTKEQSDVLGSFDDVVRGVCDKLPSQSPRHFKNIGLAREAILGKGDWFNDYVEAFKSGEQPTVLTHGDLWTTNVLFQGDSVAGVIDWQIAHPGSPTEDLQHLLTLCCPVALRERLTEPLLLYYHQKLTQKFKANGESVPFSLEKLKVDLYDLTRSYTMAMSLFATGMWSISDVILNGKDEDRRLEECYSRAEALIDETLRHLVGLKILLFTFAFDLRSFDPLDLTAAETSLCLTVRRTLFQCCSCTLCLLSMSLYHHSRAYVEAAITLIFGCGSRQRVRRKDPLSLPARGP
uniref:CHK domain-containing protein n=1 Tax=Steinernema glaseri TaxID=37863 RepID=A0A1I7ZXQ2_9BILA